MKLNRIIVAVLIAAFIAVSLAGCGREETVEITVTLTNSTAYVLEQVYFVIPHGSLSPNHDLVTPAEALQPGEERETSIWMFESDFSRGALAIFIVKGDDTQYPAESTAYVGSGENHFEITCDDMAFDIKVKAN